MEQADPVDTRRAAIFDVQRYFNAAPMAGNGGFAETLTSGVVHKWTLISRDVARDARAIVEAG